MRDAGIGAILSIVRTMWLAMATLVLMPYSIEAQTAWRDRFCPSTREEPVSKPFEPDLHRVGDQDVTPPKPMRRITASYTAEAMDMKVQGCVVIEAVVEVDGKVRRYRVRRSLEQSLDMASIEALQKWEFMPGSFQGTPIPVVVFVEMTFSREH